MFSHVLPFCSVSQHWPLRSVWTSSPRIPEPANCLGNSEILSPHIMRLLWLRSTNLVYGSLVHYTTHSQFYKVCLFVKHFNDAGNVSLDLYVK